MRVEENRPSSTIYSTTCLYNKQQRIYSMSIQFKVLNSKITTSNINTKYTFLFILETNSF